MSPKTRVLIIDDDVVMAKYLATHLSRRSFEVSFATGGPEALAAFLAVAEMNLSFLEGLSAADRATPFSHPDYGALTVDWIVHQMAGHQIHHLKQLEQLGT